MSGNCCCNKTIYLCYFNKAKIFDKYIFNKITSETKNIISGYNFVNFFLWSENHNGKWMMHKDRILIYYGDEDALFLPLGFSEIKLYELIELSDMMIGNGHSGNFIYVDYDYIKNNKEILNYFNVEIDENNSDYIYSIDALIELSGKRLKKKKNLVRQFEKNNPNYYVKELEEKDFEACIELAEYWAKYKNSGNSTNFSDDIKPLKNALENFRELELEGIGIFIRGCLMAFSIFNEQNNEISICHFEKYCPEIKGAGQIINLETAKHLQKKAYKYLNREQDLGIEGLRKAKTSYDPLYKKTISKLYRIK